MDEKVTMMTVLNELRDFREENNKCWEQNDKRLDKMDTRLDTLDYRVLNLEKGRKQDRKEIMDVLENMQKSIDNRFAEMKDYMDMKFEKIDMAFAVNNMEHAEFRKLLKAYGIKLDFYGARIQSLEKWREEIEGGSFVGAY